jgi:hypothetical protein
MQPINPLWRAETFRCAQLRSTSLSTVSMDHQADLADQYLTFLQEAGYASSGPTTDARMRRLLRRAFGLEIAETVPTGNRSDSNGDSQRQTDDSVSPTSTRRRTGRASGNRSGRQT